MAVLYNQTHQDRPFQKKLTKTTVDKIPYQNTGQKYYADSELLGLGLVVGQKTKTYVVQKYMRGKTIRITIGHHGILTAEQARKEAIKKLADMERGIDPRDRKNLVLAQNVTLNTAFDAYLEARKTLKSSTIAGYRKLLNGPLGVWKDKRLVDITKDMVGARHTSIAENRVRNPEKGKAGAYANQAMVFLRLIFNFAMAHYQTKNGEYIIKENPVKRLSETRAWYEDVRRVSVITQEQLPRWVNAVMSLNIDEHGRSADVTRDYLLFLLFTGLRRSEGACLKWEHVDMQGRTFTVCNTKNGTDHTLPMSGFLNDLLKKRQSSKINDYVFPSYVKEGGYLVEPQKYMDIVTQESGVDFILHDLRRTFLTIADSVDTPTYVSQAMPEHHQYDT